MGHDFDYTTSARRLWARYPLLTYLSIQVTFWIFATLLLGIVLHVHSLQVAEMANLAPLSELAPIVKVSVIFGTLYAIMAGCASYFLERSLFRESRLGVIIMLTTAVSFAVLAVLLALVRLVWADWFMPVYSGKFQLTDASWKYFFTIVLIYFLAMTLVINFINQLNNRYGRGVLLPLVMGRYRQPRQEERVFMFMDLKSSTSLAEKLGHLRYSSFIRDSFMDINNMTSLFDAEIYQYVGDEVVLSWRMKNGVAKANCLVFFFACMEAIKKRSSFYLTTYGILPEFKAGVHAGEVVAVEIGGIKREIAYHGEVLHLSARIQGLCNQYGQQLIVSSALLESIDLPSNLQAVPLGEVVLRGKEDKIFVTAISKT